MVNKKSKQKETPQKNLRENSWIILLIVMVAVLATSFFINKDHQNNNVLIETDDSDETINWDRFKTTEIELQKSFNISSSGVYKFSGALKDGLITVNAGSEGVVKIILADASIINSSGPAIACYSADDLVIELSGENTLVDAESYATDYDEDVKGAIYSKSDLTFTGDGKLVLKANYEDGIVSKDDLKFLKGNYDITAKDDAIRGKDSVYIVDGVYTLRSGADAIKSTNEIDVGKGFVLIEGGKFDIVSSGKGIKAINSVLVYGGEYSIDSYDDALHSNNYLGITDGKITIESSDDGIHADSDLMIDGGTININKSYEGIEAARITINNGDLSIASSDDGINAGGGNDASSADWPNQGDPKAEEDCVITINGGNLSINATGDGIDSNGSVIINDGNIIVDGPTNDRNGALDAGLEFKINGGKIIAIGASGMATGFSDSSTVNNLSIYFTAFYPAGTKIEITDQNNEVIMSHTSKKAFNHIAAASSDLQSGSEYNLLINEKLYQTFTIESLTTELGERFNYFNDFRR